MYVYIYTHIIMCMHTALVWPISPLKDPSYFNGYPSFKSTYD